MIGCHSFFTAIAIELSNLAELHTLAGCVVVVGFWLGILGLAKGRLWWGTALVGDGLGDGEQLTPTLTVGEREPGACKNGATGTSCRLRGRGSPFLATFSVPWHPFL